MTPFDTRIDTGSEAYARQREGMLALVAELHALRERAAQASERSRKTFEARGALLPRERLARLLDRPCSTPAPTARR